MTDGIQISRKMQMLNVVAMVTLLGISVASACAWASTNHIITVSMVQLYCNFPCKILFVVIAQQFGQRLTVQSSETATGELIVRGIVGDTVQFVIEVPTTKIGWDDLTSSGDDRGRHSRRSDNYLSQDLSALN